MKEGGEKPRGARMADKAGWIKKSSGGLLGLWKDRYLLLCQAQLLVYENEDEQKCVETVELGSYEKCQDLRALLKRKHRFILQRSPGNKVSDIKFQATSGEEKESWIKALNEGINRGKNKAFDEVKVDKSCALEHVTRDRVRGGQRRRPPTRVHLKEVANAASDGLLRLDLEVPDSGPPVFVPSNDVSAAQPREILRPPVPPTKPSSAPETTSLGDSRVLPDKLKVSWESASPKEPPDFESTELQVPRSETPEAVPKEGGKPPTPPPKILSEKLRASMSGMGTSGPAQIPEASETSAPAPARISVNGMDDSPEPVKPPQASSVLETPSKDVTTPTTLPHWNLPSHFHPRCSSLGDLLGEGPRRPRQPGERLYRAQLEVKVASEQTEKLLNKVLDSEPASGGTEALLSQAVEQLRQANQVLQEMRDLGELSQEAPGLQKDRKSVV